MIQIEEYLNFYQPGMLVQTNPNIPKYFDGQVMVIHKAVVLEVRLIGEHTLEEKVAAFNELRSEREKIHFMNRLINLKVEIIESSEKTHWWKKGENYFTQSLLLSSEELNDFENDYLENLESDGLEKEEEHQVPEQIENLVGELFFVPLGQTIFWKEQVCIQPKNIPLI